MLLSSTTFCISKKIDLLTSRLRLIEQHQEIYVKLITLKLLASSLWMSLAVLAHANDHIAEKPERVSPILIGQKIPSAALKKLDGNSIDLQQAINNKASLIIVYRGGWCPYCNTHFQDLRKILPKYAEKGLNIVALSPDSTESLMETDETYGEVYKLYSDSDMNAAKSLGLAYRVSDSMNKTLKSYDIDLQEASGKNHGLLPVPAVFLVNKSGEITFSFVSPNYKIRASNAVVSAAIEELL